MTIKRKICFYLKTDLTRRCTGMIVAMLAGMLLSACGYAAPTDLLVETKPVETQTATQTPNNTMTPTMDATATMESLIAQRQTEIAANVNAFIQAEGKYSEEELRKSPYWFNSDDDPNQPLPLGMLDLTTAQTIFIDYINTEETLHLFLGTYNAEGKRIVIDYSGRMDVLPKVYVVKSVFINDAGLVDVRDVFDYVVLIDSYVGQPLSFGIGYLIQTPEMTEEYAKALKSQGMNPENVRRKTELVSQAAGYSRDIFALLSKDHVSSKIQIPDSVIQKDDTMGVIWFDDGNLMEINDFSAIYKDQPHQAVTAIYLRDPYGNQ